MLALKVKHIIVYIIKLLQERSEILKETDQFKHTGLKAAMVSVLPMTNFSSAIDYPHPSVTLVSDDMRREFGGEFYISLFSKPEINLKGA